ncbi:hypothetical protein AVEN_193121-1 [Araneus ventricosus]|uniref:Uncharacterized protein n=1 Tax=Araneus ventricosus TaxID=182803 RepID=A0A4Y2AZZ8_ARAVE|nr:hypothetical protein AVEN_193121-1 [Araneus ventricosus]
MKAAVAWWSGLGFGVRGFQVLNHVSSKIRCLAWDMLNLMPWAKCIPAGVVREFVEDVPAQVPSSSTLVQGYEVHPTITLVFLSKRGVNTAKLN